MGRVIEPNPMGRTHEERLALFNEHKGLAGWALRRWPPKVLSRGEVYQQMLILLWSMTGTWDPARSKMATLASASMRHAEAVLLYRGRFRVKYASCGGSSGTVVTFSSLSSLNTASTRSGALRAIGAAGRFVRDTHDLRVEQVLAGPDDVAEWIDEDDRRAAPARLEALMRDAGLKPRWRLVLELRYLRGMTLREVSTVVGFSPERARQIEHAALARLREFAEGVAA